VDQRYPDLPEAERARRVEAAYRAHFARLALASAKARGAKATTRLPRSCRDGAGPLCTPENRCPAHRIDVDPPTVGDVLAGGAE